MRGIERPHTLGNRGAIPDFVGLPDVQEIDIRLAILLEAIDHSANRVLLAKLPT
jgi:hypothetical protein